MHTLSIIDTVIIVAGRIASGKTTISKYLSSKFNCSYISISTFLKNELTRRNKEITRQNLQKIGEELYIEKGEEFILVESLSLVHLKNNMCIIDGIRYPEGVEIIRNKYSKKCYTIFLDIEAETRFSRYEEKISKDEWELIDNSMTEKAIDKIRGLSDIIFKAPLDIKTITKGIETYIALVGDSSKSTKELNQYKLPYVLCIGQLTEDHYCEVERIPPNNEFANVIDEIVTYGGNSTNSAFCFSQLGCNTCIYTQTSNRFPEKLFEDLEKDNIRSTKIKKNLNSHPICYMYYFDNQSINFYQFADKYSIEKIDIENYYDLVFISGTRELMLSALQAIKKCAKRPFVAWNPGYETRFLGIDIIKELAIQSDLLIVNENEYLYLKRILDTTPLIDLTKIVVITYGSNGSTALSKEIQVNFPSLPITPINSFGAGDFFAASFSLKYFITKNLIDSISFATRMTCYPLSSKTSRNYL